MCVFGSAFLVFVCGCLPDSDGDAVYLSVSNIYYIYLTLGCCNMDPSLLLHLRYDDADDIFSE